MYYTKALKWIYYIGGRSKAGKLMAIKMGLAWDPREDFSQMEPWVPFTLSFLACEEGTLDLLERRKRQFRKQALINDWFLPSSDLLLLLNSLPEVGFTQELPRKVCLDLSVDEFEALGQGVEALGLRTKGRFIRQALQLYLKLWKYLNLGYSLQVFKGRSVSTYTNLEAVDNPGETPPQAFPEDTDVGELKKVCMDINPEEFLQLEMAVKTLGMRTKARLLRRAIRLHLKLGRYTALRYTMQVVKGGKIYAFTMRELREPPIL